jgi:hypothetical protein
MSRAGIPGRVPREYEPGEEPKLTTLWNHNPPDWNYEPAPLEHNLAQARGMLARLYGAKLERIAEAEAGECGDCKRHADRLRYGCLALCRRCALSRRNARDEEAA